MSRWPPSMRASRLAQTPVSSILSEASIGKACLREMGVSPAAARRRVMPEPEVPPDPARPHHEHLLRRPLRGPPAAPHLPRRLLRLPLHVSRPSPSSWASGASSSPRASTGARRRPRRRSSSTACRREDLAQPETWRGLHVLVQVEADGRPASRCAPPTTTTARPTPSASTT